MTPEELEAELAEVKAQLANLQAIVDDQAVPVGKITNIQDSLDELANRINAVLPPDDPDAEFYAVQPSALFWRLRGEERAEVIADLREWVGEVYRENFGYVSAKLPDCWTEHNLILTVVDILKELHSVLYLRPRTTTRQLMTQADFFTRYLVPLAEMGAAEAKNCEHSRAKLTRSIGGVNVA